MSDIVEGSILAAIHINHIKGGQQLNIMDHCSCQPVFLQCSSRMSFACSKWLMISHIFSESPYWTYFTRYCTSPCAAWCCLIALPSTYSSPLVYRGGDGQPSLLDFNGWSRLIWKTLWIFFNAWYLLDHRPRQYTVLPMLSLMLKGPT